MCHAGLKGCLGGEKVDAIINVAGGWAGGNAASKGEASHEATCAVVCLLHWKPDDYELFIHIFLQYSHKDRYFHGS